MTSNALESQCLGNLETQLHNNEIGGMTVQSYLESLNYLKFAAKMSSFTVDLI